MHLSKGELQIIIQGMDSKCFLGFHDIWRIPKVLKLFLKKLTLSINLQNNSLNLLDKIWILLKTVWSFCYWYFKEFIQQLRIVSIFIKIIRRIISSKEYSEDEWNYEDECKGKVGWPIAEFELILIFADDVTICGIIDPTIPAMNVHLKLKIKITSSSFFLS